MVIIFLLYFPILLSFSFSFLLHVFKKHIQLLSLDLVTIFNITMRVLNSSLLPKWIGLSKDIDKDIEKLITCTKDIDFQSIDINDEIDVDKEIIKDEDEDYDKLVEDGGNFPPPISSLNKLGQPTFILVPVRENGRMQLNKVRIRRPEILYATREDGRLRLFLIPDYCVEDNIKEEEEEEPQEKEEEEGQELVDEDGKEEKKENDEVVQEISRHNHTNIDIEGLNFSSDRFMKYHEVLNHIEHHHHAHRSHHHLHKYGFCIA
uniref:FAF domain-containing protein n=1 Tax=Phaseolus vulgaris TaxID=3885 RepID=V7BGW9_PHAVU|nr:hypothetical protein PHAVU_007G182900g [Phaseolus vulgaris]ESW16760.1 hypothetical protein PHAVU_007G182900g [Phaseolus vulgaris]